MKDSLVDPQVVMRLANTPLAARQAMLGHMSGRHQSPHRGSSVEFAEYRKYVPGDDTRRVDWRVYGRSDRFYIKEFEADTNLRLCLVMDTSGSMAFGSGNVTKWDYAKKLAATLAHLAIGQGDAAGLYAGGPELHCAIPPSRRPTHYMTLNNALQDMKPVAETGLTDHLHQLAEEIPQRALVVLISDLLDDPDKIIDCWQHLRFRKHDLAVFQILDPEERTLDFSQPMRFVDLEGEDAVIAEPELIQERYRAAVARHSAALQVGVAQCQIDFREVSTDEEQEQVLARFLTQRLGIQG
jgi:uncharacterized protein (DUF58 family)